MWHSCAHVLKALTDKAGLKKREKLVWTDEMQIAFDKMKKLIAACAKIAYPWVHKCWVGASGVSGDFESSQNKARVYVVAMNAIVLLH